MTERTVNHATFTLERRYDAAPGRVFSAWSQKSAKAGWFVEDEGWTTERYELDFREGGRESWRGSGSHGVVSNETVYQDIVEDRRIVFAYAMTVGEKRISASLATVELVPDGAGTLLVFTEQAAFLDGADTPADRSSGWGGLLDKLGQALRDA